MTPAEIQSIRQLTSDADLDTVQQGLELLAVLAANPKDVATVLGYDESIQTAEELSIEHCHPKHLFFMKAWVLGYLAQQGVAWVQQLTSLALHDKPLTTLPENIAALSQLQELSLQGNSLTVIPPQIASLSKLRRLDFEDNYIKEIPEFIGNLQHMEELILLANDVAKLPKHLCKLQKLTLLEMTWNHLWVLENGAVTLSLDNDQWAHQTVRQQVCQMSSLRSLQLSCSYIDEFPADWSKLVDLTDLNISVMRLRHKPLWLCTIPNLKRLRLWVYKKEQETNAMLHKLLPNCIIEGA